MITIPNSDFKKMKAIIDAKWPNENIYCDEGESSFCLYDGKCAEFIPKLGHVKVQLGDNWVFSVSPEDYMVEEKGSNYTYCYFGIMGN